MLDRSHVLVIMLALACSTRSSDEPEHFEQRMEPEAPDVSGGRYASKVDFSGSFFM